MQWNFTPIIANKPFLSVSKQILPSFGLISLYTWTSFSPTRMCFSGGPNFQFRILSPPNAPIPTFSLGGEKKERKGQSRWEKIVSRLGRSGRERASFPKWKIFLGHSLSHATGTNSLFSSDWEQWPTELSARTHRSQSNLGCLAWTGTGRETER